MGEVGWLVGLDGEVDWLAVLDGGSGLVRGDGWGKWAG